jgi:site-specific DNA-methyltransferase (adenine-specific)
LCVYAFRPGRVWNHGGKNPPPNNVLVSDSFRYGQPGKNGHPTQKPLPVVLPLVLASSRPGDLVLDAFAGSGTVGIACLKAGRRFIGIELDPEFARLAVSQMAEASNQTGLFAGLAQPTLFPGEGGPP